ncbi:tetratricopeptide repeat protein [Anabaena sp. CA = ATCC 33047]|uniref:tetratricopeptide repeat protein n=1 Tax=Anabaena sp. (strain CA / ATCC 33047) TaxID=52271 RepID=UPI00082B42E8|nr:tetratricopeptide repeat protein [Anabaena sp. CA = ATCC 33047]
MQWDEFLRQESATHELSPKQTEAFLVRLQVENSSKSEKEIAKKIGIEHNAFKKLMTEVYAKFSEKCSDLKNPKSRRKFATLKAYLTAKYNGVPHTQPIKQIHHNIPAAVPWERFVGREAELEKLHEMIQQSQQVAIVAVAGMGGVGKTELATQYAQQNLSNYPGGVCWLSAQGIDVKIQILRFAESKFKFIAPEDWELADRVKYCWDRWDAGDVLLVFDDVTDYITQVKPYLSSVSSRFKVLLTTRLGFDRTLSQLSLGVLNPLAAMKLLKLLVERDRLKNEPWVARKICKFLGYLPLALELVGRYLDTMPDLSLQTLLKRLEKKRLEHEAMVKANPLMRYEYGVAEAFDLSWEQLDENAKNLGYWLSLYALADIPLFMEEIADDEQQEIREKAIADLRKLHLLQRPSQGIYRLHPLIRQYFQMKLNESSQADEVKTVFAAQMVEVAKQIPQQPIRGLIQQLTPLIPHLAEVANHLTDYIRDKDLITFFTGLGSFYQGQELYKEAEPWLLQCLEIVKNRLGSEHLDVTTSQNNLAVIFESTGRYNEAEILYQQVLELRKRLLGAEHPRVATSLSNLAKLYSATGRYREAETLYKQALELRQRLLGKEHPDVATSLNNLAAIYESIGRYREAEPLYQQALELRQRLLGLENPDVAISLNNLAALYCVTGRYREAEPLYQQALELWKRLLGEEHPNVSMSLNNLAELYRLMERYREAELLYQQALELWKHLLGEEHRNVALTLNNLAELYRLTGRESEAEHLLQQALALRQRLLGAEHPDVAQSLNNLALLYKLTGRYKEAEPLYQQALVICERTLGIAHPHTMTVRGNYAQFLREAYR